MSSAKGKLPPPNALAMIVCEGLWRDPAGKLFILGCLSEINFDVFPAVQTVLAVHIAMTSGRGRVPFRVRLVDADEEREPVWTTEGEIGLDHPRIVAEVDLVMKDITFPEAGEYRVQLFAGGELIVERRLNVA
jgi:hypothetical protein